jgi:Sulfite exporter TauE/SafE
MMAPPRADQIDCFHRGQGPVCGDPNRNRFPSVGPLCVIAELHRVGIPDVGRFCAVRRRGFRCQMVDGAVGMAYGLSATSVLLSFGVPPATASASVHAAEVFTTGISGAAHWRLGNVQWATVWKLAIPGMLGIRLPASLTSRVVYLSSANRSRVVFIPGASAVFDPEQPFHSRTGSLWQLPTAARTGSASSVRIRPQ